MDDSNVTLNLEMSIFLSHLNLVKVTHEEGEPAAAIEVVVSGAGTGSMGTMVFFSYKLLTCTEFNYMSIKETS